MSERIKNNKIIRTKTSYSNEGLVFGRHPVLELLDCGLQIKKIILSLSTQGSIIQEIIDAAQNAGVRIERVKRDYFEKRFRNLNHQGVAAEFELPKQYELKDVLNSCSDKKDVCIIILDGIEDPRNFGAIVRTAQALGIDAIITRNRRSAGISPSAVKSSAGALLTYPCVFVSNLNYAIGELKKNDFWIYGLESDVDKSIWGVDLLGKTAMVFGGEGSGLSRLTKEKCDELLSIPMSGKMSSLNVSVAVSLSIGEFVRQVNKDRGL